MRGTCGHTRLFDNFDLPCLRCTDHAIIQIYLARLQAMCLWLRTGDVPISALWRTAGSYGCRCDNQLKKVTAHLKNNNGCSSGGAAIVSKLFTDRSKKIGSEGFFSHWILSTDLHKSFDLLAVELSFCWSNWLNLVCDRRWQSNGLSNHLQVFVESSCLCPKSFEQRLSRRLHLTSNLMHLVTVSRIMTDFYWLPVLPPVKGSPGWTTCVQSQILTCTLSFNSDP